MMRLLTKIRGHSWREASFGARFKGSDTAVLNELGKKESEVTETASESVNLGAFWIALARRLSRPSEKAQSRSARKIPAVSHSSNGVGCPLFLLSAFFAPFF